MRIYRPESTRAIPPEAKVNKATGTVTYTGRDGRPVRAVLTDTGKMRVAQGVWHVAFRDGLDREQDIAGFEHEGASRTLAAKIQTLIDLCGEPMPTDLREYVNRLPTRIVTGLQDVGLLAKDQVAVAAPLADLVTAYLSALAARGRSAKYIRQTAAMIQETFTTCNFASWRDITRDKVSAFLNDLREGPRHVSYGRSNSFLRAVLGFCNWVATDRGWAQESPLRVLKRLDERQDRRHPRRAITMPEFKRLLDATAKGPERFGFSGRDRAALYMLTFETGMRASEIRRLRTADFDLANHRVLIRGVKATKNKVDRWQSLSPGLCEDLAQVLANRTPNATPFPVSIRTADMLKEDLQNAGIAYQAPDGTFFDFHALRGETASALIATGTNIKTAQGILRHATAAMTMDVYAKVMDEQDAGRAVAGLRDLYADKPEQEIKQVALRTGTDDMPAELYGELYAKDELDRTTSDNIGQGNADSVSKTPLASRKQGCAPIAGVLRW